MARLRLIKRKECWVPTLRGWLTLLLCTTAVLVLCISSLYPFLAVNDAIKADILVVEGWLPDYALERAIVEFESHPYRKMITTGGPLERGYHLSAYKSYAELAAESLKRLGLGSEFITAVPTPPALRNRTHASAIALKKWLDDSPLAIKR